VLPDVAGCRLAWRCEPASGFGGAYYDAFLFGPNRLAVCIADVCGKGLPAALLVSIAWCERSRAIGIST
jgi:phosphoserine phosphatase RsbU/P